MKTITSLELRNDLEDIVNRVQLGESLQVTYRSKPAFVIQPISNQKDQIEPGSIEAMQEVTKLIEELHSTGQGGIIDPCRPIMEIYREDLDSNPKYNGDTL